MIKIPFNPNASLLRFECVVEYQTRAGALMALDTGASTVVLSREILESIGYDLDAVIERESFGNASREHTVPKVMLTALSLDKAKLEHVEALCYTLPDYLGIDGVIGLNFLRRFKEVSLNFEDGILSLKPKD
ncbi:MAG: aspartyl protease family protein [Candidatus Poribacteria bacterium]